jgi:hypothetical protein
MQAARKYAGQHLIKRSDCNPIKSGITYSFSRKECIVFLPRMFLVGDGSMRIAIQADEGDEVSISADYISAEQAIVTLEIENAIYNSEIEIEAVTLTIEKARELASALLSVIEAIEFVRTPTNLVQFDRRIRSSSNMN